MSWYNTYSESTRRLEQLIDNKPTLQQLLDYPEFIEILKSYNPKLLDYISVSPQIPKQMIKYLTQPPLESDSQSRKYRLPMMALMMIQTNTTCVINCFFKIEPNTQKPYFIYSFYEFLQSKEQLLPLLCGYFSQMNIVLWNNRYKETIDLVYEYRQPLFLLVNHTYNKSIVNTIMLYLNLDLTRNPNQIPERTQLKLQIIKLLFDQIKTEFQASKKEGRNQRSELIIENVCDIIIEIVEKYYLISDGKIMLETVNSQQNIDLILEILMCGKEISHSVVGLVLWLMRYYCLSSFNQEDKINPEHSKKNQERLQAQPFIKKMTELIPIVSQNIISCQNFTLYNSRLLDVFIPCLELSSKKVGEAVKKSKFLQNLINVLFKFPQLSIVHKQIERAFFAIFCSERKVCEEYRRYLFCSAGIIEMTAGEGLKRITKPNDISARLGWFGYLMKIVKVYSKIQTDDQEINNAIIQRSDLWQKFSTTLMKPYDAISFKDLGAYEGIAEKSPVQYTVRSVSGAYNALPPASKKMIQELIKEESMQQFLTTMPQKIEQTKSANSLAEDSLFMIQDFQKVTESSQKNPAINKSVPNSNSPTKIQPRGPAARSSDKASSEEAISPNSLNSSAIGAAIQENKKDQLKKEQGKSNFQQFMSNRKQEIGNQLSLQRKNSSQKRLSANKSRVTSPSPKRKRWDDGSNEPQSEQKQVTKIIPMNKPPQPQQKKQKISLTTPSVRLPVIPTQKSHFAAEVKKQEQRPFELVTGPFEKVEQNIQLQQVRVTSSLTRQTSQKQTSKSLQQSRAMSVSDIKSEKSQFQLRMAKSAVNLSGLKNVQFMRERVLQPQKKQFRKIENKDKLLLEFLGVKY